MIFKRSFKRSFKKKKIFIFAFFFSSLLSLSSHSQSLDDLEAILNEHTSIQSFINSAESLENYRNSLSLFYGKSIPKESFDTIVNQIKELLRRKPELADRIWDLREPPYHSFSFLASISTYAVDINIFLFREYMNNFRSNLRSGPSHGSKTVPLPNILEIESHSWKTMEERLEKYSREIEDFEKQMESDLNSKKMGQKKLRELRRQFFLELSKRPEFMKIKNIALLCLLESEQFIDIENSANADRILSYFATLKNHGKRSKNPFQSIEDLKLKVPNNLAGLILADLPSPKQLLAHDSLFKPKTVLSPRGKRVLAPKSSVETIEVIPLKRPFHAIWQGIIIGECVGGRPDYLHCTTPRRWFSPLLLSSDTFLVTSNSKASGTIVLYNGVLNIKNSIDVIGLDLNSFLLSKKIDPPKTIEIKDGSEIRSHAPRLGVLSRDDLPYGMTSIWDVIFSEIKRSADQKKSFVLSSSNEPFNSGAIVHAKSRPHFVLSDQVFQQGHFRHNDHISNHLSRLEHTSMYWDAPFIANPTMSSRLTFRTLLSPQDIPSPESLIKTDDLNQLLKALEKLLSLNLRFSFMGESLLPFFGKGTVESRLKALKFALSSYLIENKILTQWALNIFKDLEGVEPHELRQEFTNQLFELIDAYPRFFPAGPFMNEFEDIFINSKDQKIRNIIMLMLIESKECPPALHPHLLSELLSLYEEDVFSSDKSKVITTLLSFSRHWSKSDKGKVYELAKEVKNEKLSPLLPLFDQMKDFPGYPNFLADKLRRKSKPSLKVVLLKEIGNLTEWNESVWDSIIYTLQHSSHRIILENTLSLLKERSKWSKKIWPQLRRFFENRSYYKDLREAVSNNEYWHDYIEENNQDLTDKELRRKMIAFIEGEHYLDCSSAISFLSKSF